MKTRIAYPVILGGVVIGILSVIQMSPLSLTGNPNPGPVHPHGSSVDAAARMSTAPSGNVVEKSETEPSPGEVPERGGAPAGQKPTPVDIYHRKPIPEGQLAEHLQRYLEEMNTDDTGNASLMIARILNACSQVPATRAELQHYQQQLTQSVMSLGGSNGDVLQRMAENETRYQDCQAVSRLLPDIHQYEFLEHAAYLGHPVAQVDLAIGMRPPGYDTWSDSLKEDHRRRMGHWLQKARDHCNLRAMQAFAYPGGYGAGDYWKDPEQTDLSADLRAYGHLLASHWYVREHLKDADRWLEFQQDELQKRESQMTAADIAEGQAYGRRLYQERCSG